ncbi:MAG: ABC transporter ATP-binding protein [Anaerolineales bacterium]|nr:ABC transporter ATP-binding protein [Anaerolineales bacterium]
MTPIVRLEHVTKDYLEGGQTRSVLGGVSAAFEAGHFVAIRGRSGSGKSTLLNLIAGIDQPTGGDIYIGGVCVSRLRARERTLFRRDNLGFIFQFFNLIPTLTVLENVRLPAELAGKPTGAQASALDLLEQVGLADRCDVFPDKLSGGEQQRVAIARALAQNPRLVLADEPTGNLDDKTGDTIMGLLDRLTRQAGRSLVMVTHSRQIAARADDVFEMHGGELRAVSHEALTAAAD